MPKREKIIGKKVEEIEATLSNLGLPSQYALKLAVWIYRKRIQNYADINDIPKHVLNTLQNKFGDIHEGKDFERYPVTDGSVKHLFSNAQGQRYESIYMDNGKRKTLCVSTQAGCRMGCKFCMTGSIGYKGNLDASSIVGQLLAIPETKSVNRLVIMGMGEPFDNWAEVSRALEILTSAWGVAFGKSHITLSTVGILEGLERFLLNPRCNLAISLHSPFSDERAMLMPSERENPISEAIKLLLKYPMAKPLRLSFEYVGLGTINLSEQHAKAISEILKGLKYHINIIPWNEHPAADFKSPTIDELENFTRWLNQYGVLWTIRQSKGNEVGAACGQMAGKHTPK
ncbi:MAG TPA: radical SAM protein [Bacteroidales bacterium]|nr:radical SAM protein [Bacteroidales bacterium]